MKLFINPSSKGYLRKLANEREISTNNIRVELNRLSDADLLIYEQNGRTTGYCSKKKHRLFQEMQSLIQKYVGIDQVIYKLVSNLVKVDSSYLIGDYARGINSDLIDIISVGNLDVSELYKGSEKLRKSLVRKIRPLVITKNELRSLWDNLKMDQSILIWGEPVSKKG